MFSYFNGWRKKWGLLVLFLACVFLAIWIKGLGTGTEIAFGRNASDMNSAYKKFYNVQDKGWFSKDVQTRTLHQMISKDGRFLWRKIVVSNPEWLVGYPTGWRDTDYDAFKSMNEPVWRRQLGGFDFGECVKGEENVTHVGFDPTKRQSDPQLRSYYWQIPYWPIVLMLTLLSAWLLISQSKKKGIALPEVKDCKGNEVLAR